MLLRFGNYYSILASYRDNEKKMETTIENWGYIGITEKNMEMTVEYWVYIGMMQKNMEMTIKY